MTADTGTPPRPEPDGGSVRLDSSPDSNGGVEVGIGAAGALHTLTPTSGLRALRCGDLIRTQAGGVVTHEEIAAWEGFAVALAGAAAVLPAPMRGNGNV